MTAESDMCERLVALAPLLAATMERYYGRGDDLQGLLGVLVMGQAYGWRVMRLMTPRPKWKRYTKILGTDLKQYMLEEGFLAERSVGLKLLKTVDEYWKLVNGLLQMPREQRIKIERRQIERIAQT